MSTAMASSLLNGERALVLLFVSSIQYSTPLSLLYEGLSFSLLAIFPYSSRSPWNRTAPPSPLRPGQVLHQGFYWGMLPIFHLKIIHWLAHIIDIVMDHLSWVSSREVHSTLAQHFSIVCFIQYVAFTIANFSNHLVSYGLSSIAYGIERSEINTIIQGMLLGFILLPILLKLILQRFEHQETGRSAIFYGCLAFNLLVIVPLWRQFVQDFQVHPFLWVLKFVFSEPDRRLSLCVYWVAVIRASVLRFHNISKNSKIERILLRKYYHVVQLRGYLKKSSR